MINVKKNNSKTNKNKSLWDFSMTSALIFFLFRVPISNILGSEGNGYLAITWELYMVLGILGGHYIGNTITQMITLRISRHQYHNSTKVLISSLGFGTIVSVFGAILIYFLSDILTEGLFDVKLSSISLQLTAILLICNVLTNIFRGYFEGTGTKIPTYFSKIIEVLVTGTAACVFAFLLNNYGKKVGALLLDAQYEPAFGALGVIAGCVLGNIIALIFLIIVNVVYQIPLTELYKKDETKVLESPVNIISELLKMSVLTILPIIFFKGYRFLNISIYIRSYMAEGTTQKTIQQIGAYHGRILILLGIVCTIIIGLTGKNIRRVQNYYKKNNYQLCKKYIIDDLKHIIIYSILVAGLLLITGKNLLQILFSSASQSEVKMLQIGCLGIVFIPIVFYFCRILTAMKKESITIIVSLIAFILQTVIVSLLVKIPSVGSLSMISAEVIFWFLILIMEGMAIFGILNGKRIPFLQKTF